MSARAALTMFSPRPAVRRVREDHRFAQARRVTFGAVAKGRLNDSAAAVTHFAGPAAFREEHDKRAISPAESIGRR